MTEVMEQIRQIRDKLTLLSGECYSQELSTCPTHPIFQPQKFINLILTLPELLIKDPDQSLPVPHMHPPEGVLIRFIQDFKKENWVKVLPKEEK